LTQNQESKLEPEEPLKRINLPRLLVSIVLTSVLTTACALIGVFTGLEGGNPWMWFGLSLAITFMEIAYTSLIALRVALHNQQNPEHIRRRTLAARRREKAKQASLLLGGSPE